MRESGEMYLETILILFNRRGYVRSIDVAEEMGLSRPSVSRGMAKLREKGKPIDNVSGFDSTKESIIYITSQSSLNLYRIFFCTRSGMIKLVDGGEFDVTRKTVSATSSRQSMARKSCRPLGSLRQNQ